MSVRNIFILLFLVLFFQKTIFAYAYTPTNFYRPYDINLRMAEWKGQNVAVGMNFEYGSARTGRNGSEDKTGVLRIYNQTESALAMLMGAQRGSQIYQLAQRLIPAHGPATDDGVRGNFKLDGDFQGLDWTIWTRCRLPIKTLPGSFDFYLYVPFRYIEIDDIKWNDQTKNVLNADRDVHFYLTDDIKANVARLGGLNLDDWNKFGFGDIVLMLNWFKDFKQTKEHLKNVRLTGRLGLTIPSGSMKDEDKAFSLPLGNDGAWGIPFAASLDLNFVRKLKAGLEFEMLFLFDETSERRLKTDEHQTDYLLLHKGIVTKSFGFTWKFNLFVQAQHFFKGLSGMVAYQFLKHDDDTLTPQSNDFSYHIINSAQSLQEWGMQNFVFQLNYDFFKECKNSWFKPQFSLFYKMPITGRRVINPHTFGGQIALNF